MFGQSFLIYKLASGATRLAARALGASDSTADKIGTAAGTYIGGWTAIITVDPVGGAGIAVETANKVDNYINEEKT